MKNTRTSQIIQSVLWGALILLLPITSLPLIANRLGSTVSPAALIPLALLAALWWLPRLLRGGSLPGQSIPLLAFMACAVITGLISFFRVIPPFQDAQPWREMLQSLATLAVGAVFYLVSAAWPRDEKAFRFSLRLMNCAGLLLMGWCAVQWLAGRADAWPQWVRSIQNLISTGDLYKGRLTGFAYEPSWLSHQLNMLFLPFWLASTVRGFSAHNRKFLGISPENFLLAGGIVMLYLTKSRLGLLSFLLYVSFLLLLWSVRIVRRLQTRYTTRSAKHWTAILFYGGLSLLAILLLLGTGFYLSKTDPRMADLFDFETLRTKSFLDYAENLAFSARIVYWQAGWDTFARHPLLGVGLGNAGFYFSDHLHPAAWEIIEVRQVMYRMTAVPNIKNLWIRLLAETGLAGFGIFAAWLAVMAATGITLLRKNSRYMQTAGLAVILALMGLLVEGFSIDTFALPYYWVVLGLGTAVYGHSTAQTNPPQTAAAGFQEAPHETRRLERKE